MLEKNMVFLFQRVWGNLVDKCVFDMDNGHFEYGTDLDYIPY